MNHLLRSTAPISDAGWERIDEEARERLTAALAARRLVDFVGPKGWEHSATNLGRTVRLDGAPTEGVTALQRRVLPLVELRGDFTLSREELRDAERGAADVDLSELDRAALRIAEAENVAVLHGFAQAGMAGVTDATSHPPIPLGDDFDAYPDKVAKAVELMLAAGIDGAYGLALGPACYTGVIEATEHGGILVFDHLHQILGGPIVRAAGIVGAVVLSLRGGDFLLECGQDLSVGYDHHDADVVHLYLEESFSFRVATPEAGVALTLE
jgi:uncharacterized linocin/CFP29 family protein